LWSGRASVGHCATSRDSLVLLPGYRDPQMANPGDPIPQPPFDVATHAAQQSDSGAFEPARRSHQLGVECLETDGGMPNW
jgi:hypothetical protein